LTGGALWAAWNAFASGLGRFFDYVGRNRWAQVALGLLVAFLGYRRAIKKATKAGEEVGRVKTMEKIEAKTTKVLESIDEAENRVTRDLNNRSLRELSRDDPDNAGRVERP
jgi:flagellar biosynthesis/type III secretory pathway M-ring protein FliF/YscJ